jgi:hypothetical protein
MAHSSPEPAAGWLGGGECLLGGASAEPRFRQASGFGAGGERGYTGNTHPPLGVVPLPVVLFTPTECA